MITGHKNKGLLVFRREINGENKEIRFSLGDKKFYRTLKSGRVKELPDTSTASFFRGISPDQIAQAFEGDPVYAELIRMVVHKETSKNRRLENFASIFSNVADYLHYESYMLLGIRFANYYSGVFSEPVSQFSKPVIRFMRESGIEIDAAWEPAYKRFPDLLTNLCQYVLEKWTDDLEVYRMLYSIVRNTNAWNRFALLVTPPTQRLDHNDYYTRNEYGFGAEYKALFDYVVRCNNVEAMRAHDVVQEYFDYLKMAREIEKMKEAVRLRERDPQIDIRNLGFVNYRKIEKYPQYLTVRHRVVDRNFRIMDKQYDDIKFAANVDINCEAVIGEYCVVMPKTSQDIKNEGTDLHHCVGSYVDSVLDGKTQIAFMRRKDTPDESLITLEIRANGIQQVRGYSNRVPDETEINWLKLYAKRKNLNYMDVVRDESKPTPTPNVRTDVQVA